MLKSARTNLAGNLTLEPGHLQSERNVFFDVDDTLIFWPQKARELGLDDRNSIEIGVDGVDGYQISVIPNEQMIEFMEGLKAQGSGIVVWSHGGYKWALAVVNALGIAHLVDLVLTKPNLMMDDKEVEHLGKTVWFGPNKIINK